MKLETQAGLDSIFLPGGIVLQSLPLYQYSNKSKKRKAVATGALALSEGLRLAILTMPPWLPQMVESDSSAENRKYEYVANSIMGGAGYYLMSRMARFFINTARDYFRQQTQIRDLYPPKIHPSHGARPENQEPGDLEKRL